MIDLDDLYKVGPYSLKKEEKNKILIEYLNYLTLHHINHCEPYKKIHQALKTININFERLEDFPFLPVRLFKDFTLKSIDDSEVFKVLTSSGTTSQKVSRIFTDKNTSLYQTKTLVKILQNFIGSKRLPMIIIDTSNVIKDRNLFSARGAGILGLSTFGRDHFYLLDEEMNIDINGFEQFLEKHEREELLLFGFTFMVLQYFYKNLLRTGKKYNLQRGTLIHSGGWKKLTEEAVDNKIFKKSLKDLLGLKKIFNFYGMVEQVGSIFMECENGNLHAPIFSDVIIRNPYDWSDSGFNKEGIIEVISILPHSYPGHILLTEDTGVVLGEDNCTCGRYGKYFKIIGRIPKAEIRGCSDTHAYQSI